MTKIMLSVGLIGIVALAGLLILRIIQPIGYLIPLGLWLVWMIRTYIDAVKHMHQKGFDTSRAIAIPLLTVLTGVGIGISWIFGHQAGTVMVLTTAAGAGLVGMLIYPTVRYRRLLDYYRRHER